MKRSTAVLGSGLKVRGRVKGAGDLRVEAQIHGDVVVSGALEVAPDGSIVGGAHAESVVVEGVVDGTLRADGAVHVAASGRVTGDVQAGSLTIDEGGTFVGDVTADFDLPPEIA